MSRVYSAGSEARNPKPTERMLARRRASFRPRSGHVPSSEVETDAHPTSKPCKLFALPMEMHTERGDICYEPFSGSGSQLVAAQQTGRRCYAIEKSPPFVAVALERMAALGLKPELVDQRDETAAGRNLGGVRGRRQSCQKRF